MQIHLIKKRLWFPPVSDADEDGLLAIGGDLSVERLLLAYSSGIFPWFEDKGLPFWFSPDPRLVLFPEKLKVSDSLSRILKSKRFEVRFDTAFEPVIRQCSRVQRDHEDGTWISEKFIEAYTELHRQGHAHSSEAWENGNLVGGLYGVSIGKAFFGESMFHTVSNASKVAFVTLVRSLQERGFHFIDCQVTTGHLQSLGAEEVRRSDYLGILRKAI
jgi:leucyl/phenylalanyl-tRNA---protein transferase